MAEGEPCPLASNDRRLIQKHSTVPIAASAHLEFLRESLQESEYAGTDRLSLKSTSSTKKPNQ